MTGTSTSPDNYRRECSLTSRWPRQLHQAPDISLPVQGKSLCIPATPTSYNVVTVRAHPQRRSLLPLLPQEYQPFPQRLHPILPRVFPAGTPNTATRARSDHRISMPISSARTRRASYFSSLVLVIIDLPSFLNCTRAMDTTSSHVLQSAMIASGMPVRFAR